MKVLRILIAIVLGYFTGTFNPAYLIGKTRGFDIRETGTGNAGTTNAMYVLGKRAGLIVFASDVLKTILVMSLVAWIWPEPEYLMLLAGVSCFIGHAFPYYMDFKGGKGSACFLGMVIRISPWMIPLMVLIAFVISFATDIAFLFPVSAIVIYPFIVYHMDQDIICTLVMAILIPLTLYLHRMNLGKVRSGEENGFREVMFRKVKGYGKDAQR